MGRPVASGWCVGRVDFSFAFQKKRVFCAVLLAFAMMSQAFANPHIITRIGTAPLLGHLDSTQALQREVANNERLFATGASVIGLSQSEYATVRQRIRTGNLTYGTLPRHLDAMSWATGGHVGVVRDVIIPANTQGWKTYLHEPHSLVAVYIPNGCGNISVVRQPAPWKTTPPTSPPTYPPTTPPTSPPTVAPPGPSPTPTAPTTTSPYSYIPTPPPAASGSHRFPWFLLIPIIALIGGGHGSIGTAPIGPPNGGPTPPVNCPTPTPHPIHR